MKKLLLRIFSILLPAAVPALAVNEKGDWPWNLKLHGWHDREVAEELGQGWFLNVGPTGIRIQITHENPQYLTVRYVFKKSPAHGVVAINDIIVGANGKKFTEPHTFGRRGAAKKSGWEGPMTDMAMQIEESQGAEGKLELIVWPGGDKSKETKVIVPIEPIGKFSPTWPYNCPRSDKLLTDLCDFLAEEYKRAGKFESRPHTQAACVLALMASGEKKHESLVKSIMSGYAGNRYDSTKGDGFPVWGQVHDGIVMGEYYLLTKDRSLVPAMESLSECLNDCAWPENGGFSHRPYAFIMRRLAEGGPKGYGSMALPAGLGMVALSLFKEAGLDHAEAAYQRIHQGFLDSASPSGAIGYGFNSWDHAVVVLDDPKGSPKNSPKGIGFECAEGMNGMGSYQIAWPTKEDPRYKPTDWLEKERATNRVFDMGGAKRMVCRVIAPEEPKKPIPHDGNSCDHHGRTGVGALAHSIGNSGNESWKYLADHFATGAAKSGKRLMDGHASTHMHVLWGSLGAAMASEKDFREYLEDIKWWMIMAQTHDGGYVIMPGRDYASTDHVYGTRNFPTACAALILSLKERRLQITGAARGAPSVKSTSSTTSSRVSLTPPAPVGRASRELSEEKRRELDQALVMALAELGQTGALKPLPMSLSITQAKVKLVKVQSDRRLVFQSMTSDSQSAFALDDMNLADHALLARLVSHLRPDDAEAKAMAGIYLELSGQTNVADDFFGKAGEGMKEVTDKVFE